MALWWSYRGGAISYERGTCTPAINCLLELGGATLWGKASETNMAALRLGRKARFWQIGTNMAIMFFLP